MRTLADIIGSPRFIWVSRRYRRLRNLNSQSRWQHYDLDRRGDDPDRLEDLPLLRQEDLPAVLRVGEVQSAEMQTLRQRVDELNVACEMTSLRKPTRFLSCPN